MKQELEPAFFRPKTRRLSDLTNNELVLLFKKRADAVAEALDGHVWRESVFMVYWDEFIALQESLYEIMLEIQSRYPANEISASMYLLPVIEPRSAR